MGVETALVAKTETSTAVDVAAILALFIVGTGVYGAGVRSIVGTIINGRGVGFGSEADVVALDIGVGDGVGWLSTEPQATANISAPAETLRRSLKRAENLPLGLRIDRFASDSIIRAYVIPFDPKMEEIIIIEIHDHKL